MAEKILVDKDAVRFIVDAFFGNDPAYMQELKDTLRTSYHNPVNQLSLALNAGPTVAEQMKQFDAECKAIIDKRTPFWIRWIKKHF